MKQSITLKSAGPFLLLTFIYFIVGFLTTVNGQCQGPLKIAFLSEVTTTKNSLATLISFAFFLGYLLNSAKTGRLLNKVGYKKTLIRSMQVMVLGLAFYLASALIAEYWGGAGVHLSQDFVPFGYFVFLFGSYLMGTSAAMLQVVINPYIAAYPLPGTQPVQRMNFTCAVNSFGTTIAPFFVTGVMFAGVSLDSVSADQLTIPFLVMMLIIAFTTWSTSRANLPDIEGTRENSANENTDSVTTAAADSRNAKKRSIWSFRHLKYGVIAIFFYVGTEVEIGNNMNLHAMDLMGQGFNLSPAIERKLDVRHARILPLVHRDDVERIEQRRTHHQRKTSRAQLVVAVALIEQAHSRYSQQNGERSGPRHLLMEEHRHQNRRHDGIDEEDGAGYSRRHVVETDVERSRREGEHTAQRGKTDHVSPLHLETLLSEQHHHGKHQYRQKIAIDEHRTGIESVTIEHQRAQRIGTITHGSYNARRKAFHFITACHF